MPTVNTEADSSKDIKGQADNSNNSADEDGKTEREIRCSKAKGFLADNSKNTADEDKETEKESRCSKVKGFLIKNFLPISLVTVVVFGALVPQPGVFLNHKVTPYVCVVGIFLYSGLFLKTEELISALKAYKPAGWGLFSILFLTCIIGSKLTSLLPFDQTVVIKTNTSDSSHQVSGLFGKEEFQTGFQVFFIVPCTISSGVVLVQQLDGNYALAVLLTVVCNLIGIFTVPPLLIWLLSFGSDVKFDVGSILLKMCLTILLPLLIGKALQYIRPIKKFSTNYKIPLKLISIILLVTLAWIKISSASHTGKLQTLSVVNIILLICWAVTVHTLYLIINRIASLILCFSPEETKCIVILASQKSLAVGIPVIGFLPSQLGDHGLMVLPMILSHLTIILMDSIIVTIWLKYFNAADEQPDNVPVVSLENEGQNTQDVENFALKSKLSNDGGLENERQYTKEDPKYVSHNTDEFEDVVENTAL